MNEPTWGPTHRRATTTRTESDAAARSARSPSARLRRGGAAAIALAASGALALLSAPVAHAAPGNGNGNGNRVDIGDHEGIVVATCADGGIVSGPLEGYASFHERVDRDGNVVSLAIAMEYKMTWTLSTTGESVYPHGTRRLLLEFAEGTITDSGAYRTLTLAGHGAVLNYAGISVYDMATDEVLLHKGPSVSDSADVEASNDLVCGLFGVDGA
ncbi:hypothetical protein [Agromyces sp. GXS1127]|uniref:hypothetical protein n=1 Tax=Agromyces sp. GXS1127 TaxID=3424181 RepID=UPI003D313EFD